MTHGRQTQREGLLFTMAAITLAGGYARNLEDTIAIQSGTAKIAAAVLA